MSIVLQGSTSGSITLQEPAIAGSTTLTLPATTGNVVVDTATQTLTNKTIQGGQWTSPSGSTITSGTAVASTSGTSITFTNIPSWVRRITVMFQGFGTNGSSNPLVRLGTSGGVVTSGYLGSASALSNTVGTSNYTNGFGLYNSGQWGAGVVLHGAMTISLINSNSWVASGTFARSDGTNTALLGASISLGGTLTQVQITTANGTDAFATGTVNILYE